MRRMPGEFCSAARSDFFEPQAEAIECAPQATEADCHPALGCQPITPIPRASRRAPHPGASATPAHGPRACGAGVRTAKSLVDVRNADPQQRGNLPHRHATIHRRRNPRRSFEYGVPIVVPSVRIKPSPRNHKFCAAGIPCRFRSIENRSRSGSE